MSNEYMPGLVNEDGASDGLEASASNEGSKYPTVMWMTGGPDGEKSGLDSMDYVGGFFIPTTWRKGDRLYQRIPDGANASEFIEVDFSGMGWKRDYFISNSDNKKVTGWWRKTMECSFICARDQWVVVTKVDGKDKYVGFANYNDAAAHGAPRGQMQVLTLVKGMEAFGPVVLSLKGYTMKAFKGQSDFQRTGVLSQLYEKVTHPIGKLHAADPNKPVNVNYRAVWAHVGPLLKPDGTPDFIKAGKEKFTLIAVPTYIGGTVTTKEDIGKFYVGAAIQQVTELFDSNKEWAEAWKNRKGADTAPVADEAPAAPKENVGALAAKAGL